LGIIMSRTVTIGLSTVLAATDRWAGARYTELKEWTELSDATLTKALKDLLNLGLIEAETARSESGRVYVTYKLTSLGKETTRYLRFLYYYNFAGVKESHLLEFLLKQLKNETSDIYAKYEVRSLDELWNKLEKGEISEAECREDLERLDFLESKIERVRKRLQV